MTKRRNFASLLSRMEDVTKITNLQMEEIILDQLTSKKAYQNCQRCQLKNKGLTAEGAEDN